MAKVKTVDEELAKLHEQWRDCSIQELERTHLFMDKAKYPKNAAELEGFIAMSKAKEAHSNEDNACQDKSQNADIEIFYWTNIGFLSLVIIVLTFGPIPESIAEQTSEMGLQKLWLTSFGYLVASMLSLLLSGVRPGSKFSIVLAVCWWGWFIYWICVVGEALPAFVGLILFTFTAGRLLLAVQWFFELKSTK